MSSDNSDNSGSIFFVALIIACGFAIMTKPSDDDLNEKIYSQILSEVKQMKFEENDNLLSGVIKFACIISPEECSKKILNSMVTININDNVFFKTAKVKIIDEQKLTCFGFFKTWRC